VYLCKLYGLTEKNIIGHYEGYQQGVASNHGDPKNWFPKHGKSMDTFRSDVGKILTPPKTTEDKKLYRVQVGAYSIKENAETQLANALAAGFKDAFIKYD
jgi:N-acetylmuramoyl-L-alanine amidase